MTVSSTQQKVTYVGNGVTTAFAIPFSFLASTQIEVWLRDEGVDPHTEALQATPANYSIAGSTVTMVTAPAADEKLVIKRVVPLTQLLDYIQNVNFSIETHETALDKLTQITQQLLEMIKRAALLPNTTALTSLSFPEPDANKVLAWNATEDGFENTTIDISSIDADITALQAQDVTHTTDIATNAAAIAAAVAVNVVQTADIAALDTRVDTLETNEAIQDGQISALQAQDITHTNLINDLQAQVSAGATVLGIVPLYNGQGTPFDVAELAFDGDVYSSVRIDLEIDRHDDTPDHRWSNQILYMRFKSGAWQMEAGLEVGDPTGVIFSVSTDAFNIGRLRYICDNMSGGNYEGTLQFRATPFAINPVDSQTIDNNQAVATDITELDFDGDFYTSVIVDYELQRADAGETRVTQGIFYLRFKNSTWEIEHGLMVGDLSGVTLTVNNTAGNIGTVQYVSDNMTGGGYSGKIKWKKFTFAQEA